jgi:hypothetical protein
MTDVNMQAVPFAGLARARRKQRNKKNQSDNRFLEYRLQYWINILNEILTHNGKLHEGQYESGKRTSWYNW